MLTCGVTLKLIYSWHLQKGRAESLLLPGPLWEKSQGGVQSPLPLLSFMCILALLPYKWGHWGLDQKKDFSSHPVGSRAGAAIQGFWLSRPPLLLPASHSVLCLPFSEALAPGLSHTVMTTTWGELTVSQVLCPFHAFYWTLTTL